MNEQEPCEPEAKRAKSSGAERDAEREGLRHEVPESDDVAAVAASRRPPKAGPKRGAKRPRRSAGWRRVARAAKEFAWTPRVVDGWHDRNMRFWYKEAADIDGMTGGGVSDADLAFSSEVLASLAPKSAGCQRFTRALDVGAGIGRVAKNLLSKHCDRIDLVEPISKHLEAARAQLGDAWPGDLQLSSLQSFEPASAHAYDLIWCQWTLMYVTDADVSIFLRRAADTWLAPEGLLVVKENVSFGPLGTYLDDEEGELWREDGQEPGTPGAPSAAPMSVVRTSAHYGKLFTDAGLCVLQNKKQMFSDDEMPMMCYVLQQVSEPSTTTSAALKPDASVDISDTHCATPSDGP